MKRFPQFTKFLQCRAFRACLFFSLLAQFGVAHAQTLEVSIDFETRFQTIDHFGASDCWSMQHIGGWSDVSRNRVADLLFSTKEGIGLSGWRFNIGAGINRERISAKWRTIETFELSEGEYDWDRQKEEQWFLRAAKSRGVSTFTAFANSPPARMTRNGFTNASADVGTTNLKTGYEGQYATYLLDIVEHFQRHPIQQMRVPIRWLSPINEPQWDWDESGQEGNRASNGDIESVILALSEEIQKRRMDLKILSVESGESVHLYGPFQKSIDLYGGEYGNYLGMLSDNPNLAKATGNVISSHGYWADSADDRLLSRRRELGEFLKKYPDWTYWQTEYCIMQGADNEGGGGRDLTMKTALDVARIIHLDLVEAGASAWNWWTAVSPENYKDGLIYTDYKKPGDEESIIIPKLLWVYGHFSRFVRPGAVRVNVQGGNDINGLLVSAYDNPEGKPVAVFINMSDSPIDFELNINQKPLNQALKWLRIFETSKEYDLEVGVGDSPKGGVFTIPGRSIQTIEFELQSPVSE
jgi:O-glycosyl hydrolase